MNEANVCYLPTLVLKELKAGRPCEITGGVVVSIKTKEDYGKQESRLIGKFGEIIQWKPDRTALIATRGMPDWAAKVLHAHIDEAGKSF